MGVLDKLIANAARKHGVSPDYLFKLIQYESKGDPNAISKTGARGLGQFTSGTARQYGISGRRAYDPEANIDAIARLAKDNYRSLEKTLGRPPNSEELYLAHLQGATGARNAFQNPTARAIDVLDPKHVKANLPASRRGELNTITAKEFQDLHRGNFNRSPTGTGTIDIGPTPDLKTLNPPTTTPKGDRLKPTIPLSQLAPTEASNTMARYPNYDQAIVAAINQVNQGGRGVQVAGLVMPAIRGPGGRMRPNPLKTPNVQRGLPSPEQVPGARTPTTQQEAENARRAFERQQGLKTKADRVRRGDPATIQGPQQQGAPIRGGSSQITTPAQPGSTAPISPRRVPTQRITRDQATGAATVGGAAAVGAAAGDAASRVDPAVEAVQRSINATPSLDDSGGAAQPSQPVGPQPVSRRAPEMSPNDVVGPLLQQIAPVIKQVATDPVGGPALQTAVKVGLQKKAQIDARRADMQNDPTFYQQMAARKAGGSGGADPLNERAMMMAVNQDYQTPRTSPRRQVASAVATPQQQQSQRQIPPQIAAAIAKDQARVPQQELGDNRGLPPEVAQQFPQQQIPEDPTKHGLSPAIANLPSSRSMQPQMGVAGAPGSPPMNDPSMMALMQFFMQQQQQQPDPMGMSIPMGAP